MKKVIYLFAAVIMFVFFACGGADTATEQAAEEVVSCADVCQKACCLGCKAEVVEAVCLADHSCCTSHEGYDYE